MYKNIVLNKLNDFREKAGHYWYPLAEYSKDDVLALSQRAMAMHELSHVLGLDETEDDNTYLIEDMTKPSSYDIQNIESSHLLLLYNKFSS